MAPLRLLTNLLRLLLLPLWLYRRWSWSRGQPRWVSLSIKPLLVQFRAPDTPLRRLMARTREQHTTALEAVRAQARALGRDPKIRGVLVRLPPLEAGWAACESLRDILEQLRAAGKQVACYLPEGGRNRELYVALAADRVYMAPYASLGPLGMALRPMYIRPLLDRLGVSVRAHASGEYKSAAEPALREALSEPAREQLEALLAARQHALEAALSQRGLTPEQVDDLFARALILANDAQASGVVDAVVYEDELPELLRTLAQPQPQAPISSDNPAPQPLSAARYMRLRAPLWRPWRRPATIAVVPLHGSITGEQPAGWGAGLRQSKLAPLLRSLASDPAVRAVVLHIDSPGGSALASEHMHHEIKRLGQKKPVIACFGEVAASGGYYLACACKKIVARELCITGSIGVIAATVDATRLLERAGLRPQQVRTTASADMLSITRSSTEHERALLDAHVAALYQRFLTVAAEGRGRSVEEIDRVARGRVWSGRAAQERGLIDVIGDVERAVDEARELVPELSAAQRDALQARVYRLKVGSGSGMTGALRALLFGPLWHSLQELATLEELGREPAVYYAPVAPLD